MRSLLMIAVAAILGFISAPSARAQSQPQAAPPAPSSSPANSAANAQINAAATDTSNASDKSDGKKVWTNDDFGPNAPPKPALKSKQPKAAAKPVNKQGKGAAWYRTQIKNLNAQIPPIDKQIATYHAALNGDAQPDASLEVSHHRAADWNTEIARLTQQKQSLLAQIDALQDQARHEGIEPGDLR